MVHRTHKSQSFPFISCLVIYLVTSNSTKSASTTFPSLYTSDFYQFYPLKFSLLYSHLIQATIVPCTANWTLCISPSVSGFACATDLAAIPSSSCHQSDLYKEKISSSSNGSPEPKDLFTCAVTFKHY